MRYVFGVTSSAYVSEYEMLQLSEAYDTAAANSGLAAFHYNTPFIGDALDCVSLSDDALADWANDPDCFDPDDDSDREAAYCNFYEYETADALDRCERITSAVIEAFDKVTTHIACKAYPYETLSSMAALLGYFDIDADDLSEHVDSGLRYATSLTYDNGSLGSAIFSRLLSLDSIAGRVLGGCDFLTCVHFLSSVRDLLTSKAVRFD